MKASDFDTEIAEWLSADRKEGDTLGVTLDTGESFVIYFLAEGDPSWKLNATNNLMDAYLTTFMEEAVEDIEIKDKKKRLKYLYLGE